MELPDGALALHVEQAPDGRGPVLYVKGEVDLATASQLRDCLRDLEGDVTVDLVDVSFIDSAAIGMLVGQRNRLARGDGNLTLRNPNDVVTRTLETVGLRDWIETVSTGPAFSGFHPV